MLAHTKMEAVVIPLKCWQDPQGDIVQLYSEYECSIFFGCWNASSEPADYICRLSFEHAAAVRSFGREFIPYRIPDHSHHSYILRVPDSDMQRDHVAYRQRHYPQWPCNPTEHTHFVVVGHDIYHEVLATGFTETTIPASELTDERLLRLHRSA
jgi:hypothetical protein